jgi:hypothetical protein
MLNHYWFNIFAAVLVCVILVSLFALAASPSLKPSSVELVVRSDFNERFGEKMLSQSTRVRTIPIVRSEPQPPPESPPTAAAVVEEETPLPQQRPPWDEFDGKQMTREDNICTRHNLRKVYINGGRSWRCRK